MVSLELLILMYFSSRDRTNGLVSANDRAPLEGGHDVLGGTLCFLEPSEIVPTSWYRECWLWSTQFENYGPCWVQENAL